jgi:hypothetical protein
MPGKKRGSKLVWVDPDDAPEWTEQQFGRAEVAVGNSVVTAARGTLTRARAVARGRLTRRCTSTSGFRRRCLDIFGRPGPVGRGASMMYCAIGCCGIASSLGREGSTSRRPDWPMPNIPVAYQRE